MPHGGGGGSAGGGFHGGSHGGSGSGPRYSHTYFAGARRYRYLKKDGKYEYVYMDRAPGKSDAKAVAALFTIIIVMLVFCCAAVVYEGFTPPSKLKGHYEEPDSHIMGYDYLDSTDDLEDSLREFEEKTGICPIVFAVYNEDWADYHDLEDYAYDLYVDNYVDEEHFVVVYSIAQNDPGDWYWETMIGDDTDSILTDSNVEHFGKSLQRRIGDGTAPGSCLAEEFHDAADYMMEPSTIGDVLPALVFMLLIIGFLGFAMVSAISRYSRKYERVDKQGNPVDDLDDMVTATEEPFNSEPVLKTKKAAGSVVIAVSILALIPFLIFGIRLLVKGLETVSEGNSNSPIVMGMAILWNAVIVCVLISIIRKCIKDKKKNSEDVEVSEAKRESEKNAQRAAPSSVSQYPMPEETDKPADGKMNAFEKAQVYDETLLDAALNRESHVDYDDDDYDRMRKDGYE